MKRRRHLGLAMAAVAAMSCSSLSAAASDIPPDADLVIRGRVIDRSYQELPRQAGYINLSVRWTYKVEVSKVIRGGERRHQIVVTGASDPPIRSDRDFIFYLDCQTDGTYVAHKLGKVPRSE